MGPWMYIRNWFLISFNQGHADPVTRHSASTCWASDAVYKSFQDIGTGQTLIWQLWHKVLNLHILPEAAPTVLHPPCLRSHWHSDIRRWSNTWTDSQGKSLLQIVLFGYLKQGWSWSWNSNLFLHQPHWSICEYSPSSRSLLSFGNKLNEGNWTCITSLTKGLARLQIRSTK